MTRATLALLAATALAAGLATAQEDGSTKLRGFVSRLVDAVEARQPDEWERQEERIVAAGAAALPHLERLQAGSDYRVRMLATRMAVRLRDRVDTDRDRERCLDLLLLGLADSHPMVRDLGRELTLGVRPAAAVPVLIDRLEPAEPEEVREILATLKNLTRMSIGNSPAAWKRWWEDAGPGFTPTPPPSQEESHAGPADGPVYFGQTVTSRHVVFVVDRSLSMEWGGRFVRAKQELIRTIGDLSEEAYFSVIFYGATVKGWSKKLRRASASTKRSASNFVMEQTIIPSTATYEALATAFEIDGVDTIYLLSDGDPNVGRFTGIDEICREIRSVNTFRRIKINTIGFFFGEVPPQYRNQARDTSRTREFMRRLAKENRGHFAEIDE